ncbi:hypothetical protein ACI75Y_06420 [Capnocytophaga stomatis]|uniref:Uncharacterized protein n=1 Tax=Capnocytophaga felis TaxID=2267611 RepID=A0A5M4B815_9FLAO|nr:MULTISPECIES: hypothetical protein [Capnocytophaga]GET45392.1 hypothetical protein RCZ01_06940 [Capnocytophaga felis]GET47445.1 hypothetical protein RCZ02_02760 [Capnocytophaga felis]GIM48636.1 hypothetical protein CAPN003_00880 [Capnocytophaga stomatis]
MLKYCYHDGGLEKVIVSEKILSLWISLYSIFYPQKTRILLKFHHQNDIQFFSKWKKEANQLFTEDDEEDVFIRIEAIEIQEKDNKMFCKLKCDHLKTLKFNFISVEEIELQ